MGQKSKRSDGGAWEFDGAFKDLEQQARLAMDAFMEYAYLAPVPLPIKGKPYTNTHYHMMVEKQKIVRHTLISILDGIGMFAEAQALKASDIILCELEREQ